MGCFFTSSVQRRHTTNYEEKNCEVVCENYVKICENGTDIEFVYIYQR